MEMNYDEATLRRLEAELDTLIYPGTEIMSDVGAIHFIKSDGDAGRVLVPQPSDDPHDPLNWKKSWKASAMVIVTCLSFAQGFGPFGLSPMFPQIIEAFETDLAGAVDFTGVLILVLGFSNFIWVPVASAYGRRPALIVSTIICLVSQVWRARAQTYSSFMGASILNGIGAGTAETIQPMVIADMMFLHERGAYNTLYFTTYFGSLMIGPIVAGAMTEHSNWRDFWWLNVAVHSVILIGLIFTFPETKWHRQHPKEIVPAPNLTPSAKTIMTKEVENMEQVMEATHNNQGEAQTELSKVSTAGRDPFLHKGMPSRKQFHLWQACENPARVIAQEIWTPIKLHAFPIVMFAAFVVSFSASALLVVNLTQTQNFAAPPYNFSPQAVGFTNFAIFAGAIIGLFSNGSLSDWIADRSTRKNRGIREPEMRLPTLIPYIVIMLLGNFVIAFGYQYKWDWRIIVIIGYTCVGVQTAAIPAISSTYAVDSYKPVAGSIFITITINKNVWGYGFSKFITKWILADGYVPPILMNMCLIFLCCASALVFSWKGKMFRKWTRNDTVHNM